MTAEYCGEHVCVPLCVWLFFRERISGTTRPILTKFLNTGYEWPWLGSPPAAMRYVMYFRFIDDVVFAHSGHEYRRRDKMCISKVTQQGATKI